MYFLETRSVVATYTGYYIFCESQLFPSNPSIEIDLWNMIGTLAVF